MAWTDEARKKAAETRKRNAKPKQAQKAAPKKAIPAKTERKQPGIESQAHKVRDIVTLSDAARAKSREGSTSQPKPAQKTPAKKPTNTGTSKTTKPTVRVPTVKEKSAKAAALPVVKEMLVKISSTFEESPVAQNSPNQQRKLAPLTPSASWKKRKKKNSRRT